MKYWKCMVKSLINLKEYQKCMLQQFKEMKSLNA